MASATQLSRLRNTHDRNALFNRVNRDLWNGDSFDEVELVLEIIRSVRLDHMVDSAKTFAYRKVSLRDYQYSPVRFP